MDVMELRRRILEMTSSLPQYLSHKSITFTENTSVIDLNVGSGLTSFIFIGNTPSIPSVPTAYAGMVNGFDASGVPTQSVSRIAFKNTSGVYDYYASNSSGQIWTYIDGIIHIDTGARYYFASGITYDFFWH